MKPRRGQMPVLVLLASCSSLCATAALLAASGLPSLPWLAGSLAWGSTIPMVLFVWITLRNLQEPDWTDPVYKATGLPDPDQANSGSAPRALLSWPG